uniref:Uncharacterized protein n=1 Tax=Ascaris lumbricoides TaxID=6252 RepID=A0A0M3HLC7_ASCLU
MSLSWESVIINLILNSRYYHQRLYRGRRCLSQPSFITNRLFEVTRRLCGLV